MPPRPITGHPVRVTPQGAARSPPTSQMQRKVLPPRPIVSHPVPRHPAPPRPHLDRRQNFTPHLAVGACRANNSRAISSSVWAGRRGRRQNFSIHLWAIARAPQGGRVPSLFCVGVPPQEAERSRPTSKMGCKVLPPRPIAGHPLRATPQGAARPPWTAQMRCTVLPPRPIA